MKTKSEEEIIGFLGGEAEKLSVKIISVEFKQGKNPSLTITIDRDGGVDLDCCAAFHNAISDLLDVLDPTFGAPYTLNVSSRGADWAFKTDDDFNSHIGSRVEVKLYSSVGGKKFLDGILTEYDGKKIILKTEKTSYTIDLKNTVKVNEYIDFE